MSYSQKSHLTYSIKTNRCCKTCAGLKQIKIVNDKKWCNKCQKYKTFTSFDNNKSTITGLSNHCKKCNAEYKKHFKMSKKSKKIRQLYIQQKRKDDINYRIKESLSCRIRNAIHRSKSKKAQNTLFLIGCDISELKSYLESKFKEGMTWKNYGEWHIDHIIPCRSFDLSNEEEQIKCFHYTNLQPLWRNENTTKSDKLPNGIRARHVI